MVSDVHPTNNCSSTTFSTNGTSYQRVCGRARGYQKGWSVAFNRYHQAGQTIDGYYVDGLSITHGNPRQHIWTFANGLYDNRSTSNNCPCAPGSEYPSPPFVGTVNQEVLTLGIFLPTTLMNHCGTDLVASLATVVTTLPNHESYRELSGTTIDNMEARIYRENIFPVGSTLIDQLELYIQ